MPTKKKITKKQSTRKKPSVKQTANSAKQHPKHFLRRYWPYIPIIAITTFGLLFGSVLPQTIGTTPPSILAYSTEMSVSGLLSNTNSERTSRGLSALSINSKLNNSASAKAIDMRDRDYWAHNTPDGQEPWIFFDAAGYNYQKAGENLAFGFATSSATITGWMNSPSHRDNMLDSEYDEVGFGFVNAPDFDGNGEQTVVVAHYGRSLGASASSTPEPEPDPEPEPQSLQASAQQSAPPPADPDPAPVVKEDPDPVENEPVEEERESSPVIQVTEPISSDSPVPQNIEPTVITRLQQWTNGEAPWSSYVLTFATLSLVIVWIVKHAVLVKRYIVRGEHFVAHHPLFDLTVVVVAAITIYLTQSSGVVL